MLVAARAIQGAFGAVLAPAALAMVTTAFTDAKERGKAFGIYGSIAGAGAAIGLLLGGVLTQYLDWRWCLYVNLIFAGIALVGTQILIVRERGSASGGLDVLSTSFISGGLFAIVYGLSHAATTATNDAASGMHVTLASAFGTPTTIACLFGGAALVALFLWRQARIERPMLPMGVILDRARGGSFLSILIAAASMFATFFFLTFYLQQVHDYSPVRTGLAFLPMVVALSATAATASTKLLPRLGPRPLTTTGMALGVGGMVIFGPADRDVQLRHARAAGAARPGHGDGPRVRDLHEHRDRARAARVRGLGLRDRQRDAAGRRVDRHRAALDRGHRRHHRVPAERHGCDRRPAEVAPARRTGARLHDGVLVGRGAVRGGDGDRRRRAAERAPAPALSAPEAESETEPELAAAV